MLVTTEKKKMERKKEYVCERSVSMTSVWNCAKECCKECTRQEMPFETAGEEVMDSDRWTGRQTRT